MTITFVREVVLRYRGPRRKAAGDAVSSPQKAAAFLRRIFPDNVREHFAVLLLDARNEVTAYFVVATGTASSCPVGVREVFQAAVMAGAISIIAAHNHPTGNPSPSEEDKAITRRLVEAGTLLGIPLADHLIVGQESFYSFFEEGAIKR